MFYDDSLTGLDKNEFQGTVDNFDVIETGVASPSHNNMPQYSNFYVFALSKRETTQAS